MLEKLKKFCNWFNNGLLKVIGGLVMEQKDGQWVISLTRLLTLILFGHCVFVWNKAVMAVLPIITDGAAIPQKLLEATRDVPQGELYTLWGLLGIAGVKVAGTQVGNVLTSLKGDNNGE